MAVELPLGNITSANSTLILTVNTLFPAGLALQMFSVDQGINMEEVVVADTRMSLDGHMVAGYIPNVKTVQIGLEPASPSYEALCQLYRLTEQRRGFYECSMVLTLPDLNGGAIFSWSKGVLIGGTILPPVQQLLNPTTWTFRFNYFKRG
jgi:hypothetical protein